MPMQSWKLNIFVRVIRRRMQEEGRTAEEILAEYPALTAEERQEILEALGLSYRAPLYGGMSA